jgi:hypothetical protein
MSDHGSQQGGAPCQQFLQTTSRLSSKAPGARSKNRPAYRDMSTGSLVALHAYHNRSLLTQHALVPSHSFGREGHPPVWVELVAWAPVHGAHIGGVMAGGVKVGVVTHVSWEAHFNIRLQCTQPTCAWV